MRETVNGDSKVVNYRARSLSGKGGALLTRGGAEIARPDIARLDNAAPD